jgi:hypothetical protein
MLATFFALSIASRIISFTRRCASCATGATASARIVAVSSSGVTITVTVSASFSIVSWACAVSIRMTPIRNAEPSASNARRAVAERSFKRGLPGCQWTRIGPTSLRGQWIFHFERF